LSPLHSQNFGPGRLNRLRHAGGGRRRHGPDQPAGGRFACGWNGGDLDLVVPSCSGKQAPATIVIFVKGLRRQRGVFRGRSRLDLLPARPSRDRLGRLRGSTIRLHARCQREYRQARRFESFWHPPANTENRQSAVDGARHEGRELRNDVTAAVFGRRRAEGCGAPDRSSCGSVITRPGGKRPARRFASKLPLSRRRRASGGGRLGGQSGPAATQCSCTARTPPLVAVKVRTGLAELPIMSAGGTSRGGAARRGFGHESLPDQPSRQLPTARVRPFSWPGLSCIRLVFVIVHVIAEQARPRQLDFGAAPKARGSGSQTGTARHPDDRRSRSGRRPLRAETSCSLCVALSFSTSVQPECRRI